MGRMADARKRARRSESAEEPRTGSPAAEARPAPPETGERAADPEMTFPSEEMTFPAEEPEPPPAAAAPAEGWVARDEAFTFPADKEEKGDKKLVLPASGLASDILAMAESMDVDLAAPAAAASAEAEAEPAAAKAHNISFFATPVREERKQAEAAEHLATFFLAGEEYGVDVRMVQEIIRVTDITHVPRAPDFIKGVINLRGRIIPVIDLKRKLGLGDVEATRQARIVVVKLRERLIGLLVDGASQVLKVPMSAIEAAPEEVLEHDAAGQSIRGVAKLDKRLIILMDLLKLLAPELREGATPA